MTTIAATTQEMAADSRTANEDGLIINDSTQKIVRIDGDIIGCEGDEDYIAEFLAWYEAGHDYSNRPEGIEHKEFMAAVLTSDGRLLKYFARCNPLQHEGNWLTLGSGGVIAAAALALGLSAKQAVELACRLDVWSARPVVVERR